MLLIDTQRPFCFAVEVSLAGLHYAAPMPPQWRLQWIDRAR